MSKIWVIDTNILAYWIFDQSILDFFISKGNLKQEFKDVYSKRYEDSIKLIKLLKDKKELVYIIEFCFNEVISTIRDEIRIIKMFNSGVPMSRWASERDKVIIEEEESKEVFYRIMNEIDLLIRNKETKFEFLATTELSDEDNYLDVYSSLMFLFPQIKTQDALLLTTSIFNKIDYFVTEDQRLVKSCRKLIRENYQFEIIKARTAILEVNTSIKK